MKKIIHILFFSFIVSACSDNEEVETIDYNEFLPQAEGEYDYSEDTIQEVKIELSETQKRIQLKYPEVNYDVENTLKQKAIVFMPDRLGFTFKEELIFNADSSTFHFKHWQFNDSLQTVNAFYNWLDCFMERCKSIRIGEEINGSYDPFTVWVSDTSIYYLSREQNISKKLWENILFTGKELEWNFTMHQAKQGRIEWFILDKEGENKIQ